MRDSNPADFRQGREDLSRDEVSVLLVLLTFEEGANTFNTAVNTELTDGVGVREEFRDGG